MYACCKATRATPAGTHTHTYLDIVSIGSSRLVTDDGIWQVVRGWFLFLQKGKRLKAGGAYYEQPVH